MSQVRVRLQTARVHLVFEGGEALFEREVEPLLLGLARGAHTAPVGPAPAGEAAREASPARPAWRPASTSFGTFHRQLGEGPNGAENRVAAYAFYLWNYEKKETFGTEEVAGCFAAGGEDVPDDLDASCAALERERILQPAAREGSWRLTQKGKTRVRKLLR